MVRAVDHAHNMGHYQANKADHSRRVDGKSNNCGRHQQINLPPAVQILSQRNGRLVTQEHQIQRPALGQEKQGACNHHRDNHRKLGPAGPRGAAHHPIGHTLDALFVMGKVDNQVGKGAAHRAQGHTGQQ